MGPGMLPFGDRLFFTFLRRDDLRGIWVAAGSGISWDLTINNRDESSFMGVSWDLTINNQDFIGFHGGFMGFHWI